MRIRGLKVFAELMSEEEDDVSSRRIEGKRSGEISNAFEIERVRGREFNSVERGPRHVDAMDGVQVSELLKGGGFGLVIGGFDFAADLVEGFGDEG